jgi:hypothetical protein
MSHRARSRYTPPDDERRIQPREASTIMGISPSTVLRLCRSGDLPSARIASRIVIRVGDIFDYLERQKLYGATNDELLATVKPIRPVRRGRSAPDPSGASRQRISIRSHLPSSKSAHTGA